jgi:1,4-dihydroxy-2-naphthoate polyprenyltransferase
MSNLPLWISGLRPKTLPASIAPVAVGIAAAIPIVAEAKTANDPSCAPVTHTLSGCVAPAAVTPAQPVGWPTFALLSVLCALVALFLQIAVNFANDYSDGIRGTDAGRGAREAETAKPQRITASGLVAPRSVLAAAVINAVIACIAGLGIVFITRHWWLIALGALCLVAGWFYTGGKHPYGYAGFGELSVFIFFGLVAVLGTQYVTAGAISLEGVLGAVVCGLYSCAVLMVNNLRDVDEDKESGKMTLGVRLGKHAATVVLLVTYLVCVVATMVAAFMPLYAMFRRTAGISLLCIALAVVALLLAMMVIRLAVKLVASVETGDFVRSLPMCSMTLLIFAVLFVLAEVTAVL